MKTKLFELRDRGTFVPAIAVQLVAETEAERYLLARAGYSSQNNPPMILLGKLEGGQFHYDQYAWGNNLTFATAHPYIEAAFNTLESGAVICTECLRGERKTPKISERLE